MKSIVLTLLLMATPAAPALGEPGAPAPMPSAAKESSLTSQDPLMLQILHRQLTQRNGGITAAVRVGSGQSIELQLPDLDAEPTEDIKDALNPGPSADPLDGLKPAAGLVAAKGKPVPADGAQALKPAEQLDVIHASRKDWGESAKAGADRLPDAEAETAQAD